MNIDQLIAAGAIISNSLIKKPVEWKRVDDNKKKVTSTFDVFIKKSMSAADYEFIYLNREGKEGFTARRVSRMVLLGDEGAEQIPFDLASNMHVGLLGALSAAINEVEEENKAVETEDEKN